MKIKKEGTAVVQLQHGISYLAQNGEEQCRVEDGRYRTDGAELGQRLGPADGDERHRHEHPKSRHLPVAVLDTVQVQHRQGVGRYQAVQS